MGNAYEKYIQDHKYDFWFYRIPGTDIVLERINPKEYQFEKGKRIFYKFGIQEFSSIEEAETFYNNQKEL